MSNFKMADIAKMAGVSKATVSRVLSGHKYVSPEIRKRVLDVVLDTGYKPNLIARSLIKSESHTIGFIVPSNDDEVIATLIRQVEHNLIEEGYRITICLTGYNRDKEQKFLDDLLQSNIDGLIVLTSRENTSLYQDVSVPVIMLDQYISGGAVTITTDNYYGGYLAGKRLVKNGCKNIFVVTTSSPDVAASERLSGFSQALSEVRLSYETVQCKSQLRHCEKALIKTLAIKKVDGVFATSDLFAAFTNKILEQQGLRVPEDVSIIGYGNTTISDITRPSLTTISQNIETFSQTIMDYLLAGIHKKPMKKRFIILPIEMIEKESTQ